MTGVEVGIHREAGLQTDKPRAWAPYGKGAGAFHFSGRMQGMHKKLFIPGPVEVSLDVLEAMTRPMIGHRMKEYAQLHQGVTDNLKKLLNTNEPVDRAKW